MTIRDMMRAEYARMSTANLKGILHEGAGEIAAWMQDIAVREGIEPKYLALGAEMRNEEAQEMIADIQAELRRRGEL